MEKRPENRMLKNPYNMQFSLDKEISNYVI